jgi:dihydrofolate reductase
MNATGPSSGANGAGRVFLEVTMSLDGFVAAPGVCVEHPLGEGGECLHAWLLGGPNVTTADDHRVADEMFEATGAFVLGRRTFDVGEGPWGEDGAFGKPCFVLTHRARPTLQRGATTFAFVTDGIDSALAQARAAAGGGNVCVMGGAEVAQQFLRAGLVDELRVHLSPLLLGAGTRLFDGEGSPALLRRTRVVETPAATHLQFTVER